MIDATRQLRWYIGLGLLFFAVAPTLMMTLLATDSLAPPGAFVPVLVGGPINVVGAALVVYGMRTSDPAKSARWLGIGAAVIVLGFASMYVVRSIVI